MAIIRDISIFALLLLVLATAGTLAVEAWDRECDVRESKAQKITSQGAFK